MVETISRIIKFFPLKRKIKEKEEKISATYLVEKLGLEPHPEGGYYSEVYRDASKIKKAGLPDEFDGDRHFSTSIYYLLYKDKISSFHTLKSDELWHFYEGNTSITIYEITTNGELKKHLLGRHLEKGEQYVCIVEKHSWFAAELNNKSDSSFALIGCTVAPGFEFRDYTLATFDDLKNVFPQHVDIIKRLTPQ